MLMSYWRNYSEIIGSICVATIKIEFLLIPVWLGHAAFFSSNIPQISFHIWFFVCWGSLTCCAGTVHGVRSLRQGNALISSYGVVRALKTGLTYNVAAIAGISAAEGVWRIAYNLPLSVVSAILFSCIVYLSLKTYTTC